MTLVDRPPRTAQAPRRRGLVPSARQEGTPLSEPPDDTFAAEPLESQRSSLLDGVRGTLRGLDPRSVAGPKLPLVILGLISLVAGWDDQAIGLIAPELRAEFGLSAQSLAVLASVIGFAGVLLAIPLGYLVDRVKRVRLVRIGAIGANLSSLGMALASGTGQFYGARFIGQTSQLVAKPALYPLITDYYPSTARARVISFFAATGQLGAIFGLPVAGFLIVHYGWRPAVFALAFVTTAASALTFFLREPVRGGVDRLESAVEAEAAEVPAPGLKESLRAAWAVRTLRRQAYAQGVAAAASAPTALLVSLLMAEKFYLDPSQRASLLTAQSVAALPAFLMGGVIADRMIKVRPAALVAGQAALHFVTGAMLCVIALTDSLAPFVVTTIVGPVVVASLLPASAVVVSLVTPARVRGIGFQMAAPFVLIAMVVSPSLVGLAQRMSPGQGLLLFVPLNIVGGLIVLSSAATVASDMRAARAAAVAEAASRAGTSTDGGPFLVCRDIDVAVGPVTIVHHADLDIESGECVVLLGTNGAGKSTLLRAIAGLHDPANGAVFFMGVDSTHVPAHEKVGQGIVMLPGGEAVFPTLTVEENIALAARLATPPVEAQSALSTAFDVFPSLAARKRTKAGDLSGGEQQMLAIAQVAVMRPRLVLIDELSLGLAPSAVDRAIDIVRDLLSTGSAVVLVEQSLNVALTIADRAVFMDRGRIEFDGPAQELLGRPDLLRSVFLVGGGQAMAARPRRRAPGPDGPVGAVLEATDISVSYGGLKALDGVGMRVDPGEILGVIGPNGAGKSTFLDVLSGVTIPAAGRVAITGIDVTALPPDARARQGMARTFQDARLYPGLTVREAIALAFVRHGGQSALAAALWLPKARQSEKRVLRRIDDLAEVLGLQEYLNNFVQELSTGTRRAVELATVMALEPKVVLLDEPSSGLAQAETELIGPALQRLVRETGCGLVVIEHDLPLVASISHRLVALELGRVVAEGLPAEVVNHPRVASGYLAASVDALGRSGSGMGNVASLLGVPSDTSTRRST